MAEQFKVEGEMLASKVNEGLNALRNAYREADPMNCDMFDELLLDYFGSAGFGASMGYFVEKIHAFWPSPESAIMRFPGPGCLRLTPAIMHPEEIKQFLGKLGELTHDPDGYLTGPYIYWASSPASWLRPVGNFALVSEVAALPRDSMPYDWCVLFCGTNLNLHLWGTKVG